MTTSPPRPDEAVPVVEMQGIVKRFGSVVACDEVSLRVGGGETRGLLGQNGAGKSSLMKVLIGLNQPDAGTIRIDGRPVTIKEPADARRLGIGMVHQHFSLAEPLQVWENVALSDRGRIDRAAVVAEVEAVGARFGLEVDPMAKVSRLSTGERQRVEIIKALRGEPRVLVLDEPTAVLSLAESRELFEVLGKITTETGGAVILISHKLDEILHATDSVSILRDGRLVDTLPTAETDAGTLARLMVGRDVALGENIGVAIGGVAADDPVGLATADAALDLTKVTGPAVAQDRAEEPVSAPASGGLLLAEACTTSDDGWPGLDHLDLHVGAGELVGLAGVEGNGQGALVDVLSSLLPLTGGTLEVEGATMSTGSAGELLRAGVAVIPEDRHRSGCVLEMSVAENLVLGGLGAITQRGLLNPRRMRDTALELIEEFEIATPSPETPMWALSGGNQQRVVLARELSRRPKVLVASQPMRGLDVGAIEWVASRLRQAADSGIAVLLVSSELQEIFSLADRTAVIHRGRIVGTVGRGEFDPERVGLMMGGQAA